MFRNLFSTEGRYSLLMIRLGLAAVIFPHGAQKVLGWWGGNGLEAQLNQFTGMGIPAFLAYLAIAAEFLGPIGLVTGCLTRVAAFGIGVVMVVATVMVHWQHGFFMNWWSSAEMKGQGYEYHILAFSMALALIFGGGGKWSLDRLFTTPRMPRP
ncbi:MAG: DoxX family protein [Planctomycetota bacterium]